MFVFDSRDIALERNKELAKKIETLKKNSSFKPVLETILIGEKTSSRQFFEALKAVALEVGVLYHQNNLSANISLAKISSLVEGLNENPQVNGIVLALPVPSRIAINNNQPLQDKILPSKDIDCLTTENLSKLEEGQEVFVPPVVKAVLGVLPMLGNYRQKKIVVVGATGRVGRSLVIQLKKLGLSPGLVDEHTKNLVQKTKAAEILISATGQAGLIKEEMVKKGAAIIDLGSPQGDIDFNSVSKKAAWLSPVPGGIGPLTLICLLENLFKVTFTPDVK
ncbi:tetrahydrofolate dehydrogenase/cyclohydrolase catalytic domain-containing protein [Patescibacteria group bacterium]